MRTNNRITLIYSNGVSEYDPATGEYSEPEEDSKTVPCLANFISQKLAFELYGSREEKILAVRFLQLQKSFQSAIFEGKRYKPIEEMDIPTKTAIHLKLEV